MSHMAIQSNAHASNIFHSSLCTRSCLHGTLRPVLMVHYNCKCSVRHIYEGSRPSWCTLAACAFTIVLQAVLQIPTYLIIEEYLGKDYAHRWRRNGPGAIATGNTNKAKASSQEYESLVPCCVLTLLHVSAWLLSDFPASIFKESHWWEQSCEFGGGSKVTQLRAQPEDTIFHPKAPEITATISNGL